MSKLVRTVGRSAVAEAKADQHRVIGAWVGARTVTSYGLGQSSFPPIPTGISVIGVSCKRTERSEACPLTEMGAHPHLIVEPRSPRLLSDGFVSGGGLS